MKTGKSCTDPNQPNITPDSQQPYLYYAPKASSKAQSNLHYFGKIGFKPSSVDASFSADMEAHLSSPCHKFLNRIANPEAFGIVVSEFLAEYGPTYWGESKRDHLVEPDTLKGFLCPRDAQRPGSRLVAAVEGFFNYRATRAIFYDARKPITEINSRNIDFASLTGRKADLAGHPRAEKPSGSIKRSAPPDISEGHRVEQTEAPKRQRRDLLTHDPAFLTCPVDSKKDSKEAKSSFLSRKGENPQDTQAFGSSQMSSPRGFSLPPSSEQKPVGSNTSILIQSDESDAGEEQQKERITATSVGTSTKNDRKTIKNKAHSSGHVKTKLLTDAMKERTIFLVSVHDSPLGPVPVPFTACASFNNLFPVLTEERGVAAADASNVDTITTIFNWTGGDFGGRVGGIRRNRSGDWDYFCEGLRRAHEKDAGRFQGMCEVGVKLHIGDRYRERC